MFKGNTIILRMSLVLFILIFMSSFGAWAKADVVLPTHDAITIDQIDFRSGLDSSVAEVTIDYQKIQDAFGTGGGFVNIADSSGNWVVQNVPVFSPTSTFGYDHPSITTNMPLVGLTNGIDISNMNLSIDFSSIPLTSYTNSTTNDFSIGDVANAMGGIEIPLTGYFDIEIPNLLFQIASPFITGTYQAGHKNVQAAQNQCAPMGVANSLQWLEDTQGIDVPNDHVPGLKGDNSLVGKLDTAMGRNVVNRQNGDGVNIGPILNGKLKYLSDANLGDDLITKHQGTLGGSDVSYSGLTSHAKGTVVDIDWIISELKHGEDVELVFFYTGGGGHMVEVTGAGYINGVPWITYLSDHDQTDVDPGDVLGCDKMDFSFLDGTKLLKENANMAFAISQSVPEPATIVSLLLGAMALFGYGLLRRK